MDIFDPATGSGNAALGYYLLNPGLWDGHILRIEQGRSRERPNIIRLVSDASKVQQCVFQGEMQRVRVPDAFFTHNLSLTFFPGSDLRELEKMDI